MLVYDTVTVPLMRGECTTTTDLKLTNGSQATVPPDCAPRLRL